MKSSKSIIVLVIWTTIFSLTGYSQIQSNEVIAVEEVYNHILINEVSDTNPCWPQTTNCLIPGTNMAASIFLFNSTVVKNLIADFKVNWEYVIFSDIQITEIDSENILVTGFLSGKNMEKDMINYLAFQHNWVIQNGIPIKIIQQSSLN